MPNVPEGVCLAGALVQVSAELCPATGRLNLGAQSEAPSYSLYRAGMRKADSPPTYPCQFDQASKHRNPLCGATAKHCSCS